MNKPLALATAALTALTLGTAFAQSTHDALDNEIAAGAATERVDKPAATRDEVTTSLQKARQQAPDGMANETGAGATAGQTAPSITREKVQDEMKRAQQQPHDQMDTERAAWG